jgi:hypothetical protein
MKRTLLLVAVVAFGVLICAQAANAQWASGCCAPTVTYYAPSPTVAYYAPPVATVPVTTFYAPPVATVPVTTFSPVAVPVTTFYAPPATVPVTTFHAGPVVGYDPTRILPWRRWAVFYPTF